MMVFRPRPHRPILAIFLALMSLYCAWPARASLTGEDIEFVSIPGKDDATSLTRELGVAICPISLAPAEALGAWQVDFSASATGTRIDSDAAFWRNASGGGEQSNYLVVTTARVRLGLPLGIGVGVTYGVVPGSNIATVGGEIKWTFVRGTTLIPAVAARLSHARTRGVDELDLEATALDLSVSKGLGLFTPYAGGGRLWLSSDTHDVPPDRSMNVRASTGEYRVFVGARFSMAFFRTTVEAQRAAGIDSYSARFSFTFPRLPAIPLP